MTTDDCYTTCKYICSTRSQTKRLRKDTKISTATTTPPHNHPNRYVRKKTWLLCTRICECVCLNNRVIPIPKRSPGKNECNFPFGSFSSSLPPIHQISYYTFFYSTPLLEKKNLYQQLFLLRREKNHKFIIFIPSTSTTKKQVV